jgi:hypothetical protein
MTFNILLVIKTKKGCKHTNIFQAYAHIIEAPEVSPTKLVFL